MNLIYQYWDGEVRESCRAGVMAMQEYAERIGAEYIFEENPQFLKNHFGYNFGNYSPHYGAFKPIYDETFDRYDKILFADTDVFPVEGLETNIFDEFTGEIGICTEPEQPRIRTITGGRITHEQDERFAALCKNMFGTDLPRNSYGIDVFNTGMVLYSKEGRVKARETWLDPKRYVELVRQMGLDSFYTCDQPYLHAMMFVHDFEVQRMDNGWNSYIHYSRYKGVDGRELHDWRDDNTKFVHVQFAGADNLDAETHHRIVNLPQEKWNLPS